MPIKDIYIKKLIVSNFKSLKDTEINLQRGLNIIIGKNGVGKSNLLQFIYSFINRNTFTGSRNKRNANPEFTLLIEYIEDSKNVELSLEFQKTKNPDLTTLFQEVNYTYNINLNKKIGKTKSIINHKISFNERERLSLVKKNEEFIKEVLKPLTNLHITYVRYNIPSEISWLNIPSKIKYDILEEDANFESTAFSDISLFLNLEFGIEYNFFLENKNKKKLKDPDKLKIELHKFISDYFDESEINENLNKYTPIKEIRINNNINIYTVEKCIIIENLILDFLVNGDWVPWSYLSDGTKRLFYLVAKILSENKNTILIEEPELGIHPSQLYKILDFIKEQSVNQQIIISTHSPIALDILEEDELSRIIIAKYEQSTTNFSNLNKTQINTAKRYMGEVGDLSYYWLHSDLEND